MHTTATERSTLLALHAAALAADPQTPQPDDEATKPVSADDMHVQVGNQLVPWADFWAAIDGEPAAASAPAPQQPARGVQ